VNEELTTELIAERHALRDRRDGLRRLLSSHDFMDRLSSEQIAELERDLADCEELLEAVQGELRPLLN
jgi:hypothetical protein